jgi:nitrilase
VNPEGQIIAGPLTEGESEVISDLEFTAINARKRFMDARGHYSRPELLSLLIDRTPALHIHDRSRQPAESHPPLSPSETMIEVL